MAEEQEKKFTPEESETLRQSKIQFYKDQMEFLTPLKNYEQLVTEIEELRTRRFYAQMKQAEMLAPEPEEEKDKEVPKMPEVPTKIVDTRAEEPTKRNLKKAEA